MTNVRQSEKASALSGFRALSFDCYGTLVDWEGGLIKGLHPLFSRLPDTHPLKSLQEALAAFQKVLQKAYITFEQSLEGSLTAIKDKNDNSNPRSLDAERFAESIQEWEAFPDTRDALQRLGRHFRLEILSNVGNVSFSRTLRGPLQGVHFDVIYTAEDIGSYKPDHANFPYMFSHLQAGLDIQQEEVLHVAQSLVNDHVPAKELNIKPAWITRGKDGQKGTGGTLQELSEKVSFSWRFSNLKELADAVEAELQS